MDSILPLLIDTRAASVAVRSLSDQQRKDLILHLADEVRKATSAILAENKRDLDAMSDEDPKKDRLLLTEARIIALAQSLHEIAKLDDPTGQILLERTLQDGLQLQKTTVALGVVGVIYESRPNVTLDVAALCLRSGNACVLKGGKEAAFSNNVLVETIHRSLKAFNIPTAAVTLLPTGREHVQELLTATRYVDIIIPRGSEGLIQFVRQNSLVPTIETGAGVCHTYIESSAVPEMARNIVINAKTSRPSVCNALDTIVIDRKVADSLLPQFKNGLMEFDVEIFADSEAFEILQNAGYPLLFPAQEVDFGREFLDFKCSVKVVESIDEALAHIEKYSSRHSEAIVTADAATAERFLREVDAASVYHNASTRFTDGGEFGLGAEIGISTQKLHARGPFALEKLVTEKWVVRGNGNVR
jgi:glutamate-5-semialdehyde dehydrogenase